MPDEDRTFYSDSLFLDLRIWWYHMTPSICQQMYLLEAFWFCPTRQYTTKLNSWEKELFHKFNKNNIEGEFLLLKILCWS